MLIIIALVLVAIVLLEHLIYVGVNRTLYGSPIKSHQGVEDALESTKWRLNSYDENIFHSDSFEAGWFCVYQPSQHPMRSGFYKVFSFSDGEMKPRQVDQRSELHRKLKEKHETLSG